MKKYFFIIIITLSIFSCSESLFNKIAVNDIEPVITKPVVKSFSIDESIVISWKKDKGADEYILYRSVNPNGGYSEIYRGKDFSYTDNVSRYDVGNFFYYKLSKKRESQEFSKSKYVCGVKAEIKKDVIEDNNTESNAINIDSNILTNANIYLYRDDYGNELVDTDWYKLNIQPGMYASFIINFENEPSGANWDNNLIMYSAYSDVGILQLSDQSTFNIYNTTGSRRERSFKIGVNKNNILGNPNDSGYKTIVYTLKRVSFNNINP